MNTAPTPVKSGGRRLGRRARITLVLLALALLAAWLLQPQRAGGFLLRRIGAHIFYGAPLRGSTPGANGAPAAPRQRGLMFVKNDAFERAYAMLSGKPAEDAGS